MTENLRELFASRGLDYNPHPELVPSSLAALRLGELARDRGLHDAFHDRVMDAYWAEARDIGDADELRALAAEIGLPGDDVEEVLAGDRYADRVRASTEQAASIGIGGVPGFLLDRRLLVVGAHPEPVFEQAFARLAEAS